MDDIDQIYIAKSVPNFKVSKVCFRMVFKGGF